MKTSGEITSRPIVVLIYCEPVDTVTDFFCVQASPLGTTKMPVDAPLPASSRRSFGARAKAIFSADYCPWIVFWNPFQPPNELYRLRYAVSRQYFRSHSLLVRLILNVLLLATWPLRALRLAVRSARRFGTEVLRETGKGRLRQVVEQMWLACSEFLPADMYYRYELFRPGNGPGTTYLHQPEAQCLLRSLTRQRHAGVDDKYQFHVTCLAHGLPTAPVIGVAKNGILQMTGEPPDSFFVKPVVGSRGEGASAWRPAPDSGHYLGDDDRVYRWTELVSLLEKKSHFRSQIVQPLLRSHLSIADLSSGPLATVRIITGLPPSGTPEPIAAVFRMPTSVHRYGLFSAVDIESGVLGKGDSCRPLCAGYDRHPDTDASIAQRALPFWRETVNLALSAHKMFPGYVFLGWDIALTAAGPVLLEANSDWDIISVQRPHRRPLIETRFATICALSRAAAIHSSPGE
jgi:hypothetical protein